MTSELQQSVGTNTEAAAAVAVEQRRRHTAEKKLAAFWVSLSHRTRTLFRPRERGGFHRSLSVAKLLKSEV